MKTILGSLLIVSLAACSPAHPVSDAPVAPMAAPAPAPAPAAPAVVPASAPAPTAVATDGSIYFDFDSAQLSPASEQTLSQLGPVLARQSDLKLKVEGNCDERGTEEYNLALGQHRAEAAVNYLVNLGASRAQLTAVSYGKDRPRAAGHNEDAWRQNRRDDFRAVRPDNSAAPVSANP